MKFQRHHKRSKVVFRDSVRVLCLSLDSRFTVFCLSGSDLGPGGGYGFRSQGLSVWSELSGRHRGAQRPTAEGNPRQELCQLQRLLWEVGADGESEPAVPGPAEPTGWVPGPSRVSTKVCVQRNSQLMVWSDPVFDMKVNSVHVHPQVGSGAGQKTKEKERLSAHWTFSSYLKILLMQPSSGKHPCNQKTGLIFTEKHDSSTYEQEVTWWNDTQSVSYV